MSIGASLELAASPPIRGEETRQTALVLAFTGGYLDAYTWIVHGVMANTQTANLVLLWVEGAAGRWDEAMHFVPPMLAFAVGIATSVWLRRLAEDRAGEVSTLIEIAMLVVVGILHNRMPDVAGTLGISFVAAMQAAIFTKVEGSIYSSVMITGNFRQAIEALVGAFAGRSGMLRRSGIFAGLCFSFGLGAAVGALATKGMPWLALGIPVTALLVVLLRCATGRNRAQRTEG
jgi:uncharacterized membrane protein YoaK (UPF0700 family)